MKTYKDRVFKKAMEITNHAKEQFLGNVGRWMDSHKVDCNTEIEEIFKEKLVDDDDEFYWEIKQVLNREADAIRFGDWKELQVFLDLVQEQAEEICNEFDEAVRSCGLADDEYSKNIQDKLWDIKVFARLGCEYLEDCLPDVHGWKELFGDEWENISYKKWSRTD